jgi:NADPH-dependent 2,4-dienoyl-CoA reductase/sulfur reductase-like enzyme
MSSSISQTASKSLSTSSLWLSHAGITQSQSCRSTAKFPKLITNINMKSENKTNINNQYHYDVCIVGGGIVGCSVAYMLKNAGKKVCLIEGRNIGGGKD